MKKILSSFGVIGLACALLLLPIYSFAEVGTSQSEISTHTKFYVKESR